jgi:hypothetical protein
LQKSAIEFALHIAVRHRVFADSVARRGKLAAVIGDIIMRVMSVMSSCG